MPFNPFASQVAKYNSTLPTLSNGDTSELQVDDSGRLIVATSGNSLSIDDNSGSITVDGTVTADAGTGPWPVTDNGGSLTVDATDLDIRDLTSVSDSVSAVQSGTWSVEQSGAWSVTVQEPLSVDDNGGSLTVDNDGTFAVQVDGDALTALQLIDDLVLLEDAAASGGEAGVQMLAVRQDTLASSVSADGDFASLKVDSLGRLYVTGDLTANVDDVFESGTEADAASDSAGDGIVPITGSFVDLATIAVGAGETLYITGMDISGDEQTAYQLIIDDNGTPTEWLRVGAIDGVISHTKTFPRAIEVAGGADISVILRARVLQGSSGNAAGAINAYKR